ncbi:MAG: sigma-70 family RNA polymerase sigma factor [Acidimicrobiia bacterium]
MPTSTPNRDLEDVDDVELLRSSWDNPHAFGELVARHQAFVFGAAFRITRDHSLSEDIAQEAFLRAYRTASDYRADGPVRAWLYRIAHNLAINAVTRRREIPSETSLDVPTDRTPEWHLLRATAIDDVRKAIAALPEVLRTVLIEREYHDGSYEEIAHKFDLPLNTVRTRIHRARKALEESLGDLA